jgi:hypothetical protein
VSSGDAKGTSFQRASLRVCGDGTSEKALSLGSYFCDLDLHRIAKGEVRAAHDSSEALEARR